MHVHFALIFFVASYSRFSVSCKANTVHHSMNDLLGFVRIAVNIYNARPLLYSNCRDGKSFLKGGWGCYKVDPFLCYLIFFCHVNSFYHPIG